MSLVFWIIAALMTLLAILVIAVPMARGIRRSRESTEEANIAIYRRRIRELEDEQATGSIREQNLAEARTEIDRQLLDDVGEGTGGAVARNRERGTRLPAALLASLLVPAIVVGFYAWSGIPSVPSGGPPDILQASPQAQWEFVQQQLAQLEAHVHEHPEDGQSWLMLGRVYTLLGRYEDAAVALKKAQETLGASAIILAERAQALARAAGGSFAGKPAKLIANALQMNPGNTLALWLSGVAAHQQGNKAKAMRVWQAALATVPPNSETATTIRNALAKVGGSAEEAASSPAVGDVGIEVLVQLDPKFAREFAPDTPVFVFAKAIDGPPMPLAVVRTTVGRLPQTLTLDDSNAVVKGAKLSAYRKVQIVARVSPSGQAMPSAGDVQGSSGPIRTDTDQPVTLIMNSRI